MRILSPSLRNVPITGLEWSFLQRLRSYNEYGYRVGNQDDVIRESDDIEMAQINRF